MACVTGKLSRLLISSSVTRKQLRVQQASGCINTSKISCVSSLGTRFCGLTSSSRSICTQGSGLLVKKARKCCCEALISVQASSQASSMVTVEQERSSKVERRKLEELNWDHTFVKELPGDPQEGGPVRQVRNACYSFVRPSLKISDPKLILASEEVAELVGLDTSEFERPEFALVFGGGGVIQGSQCYAQCYGGHQFGQWAGQLGDGRAITLGEVLGSHGQRWELQLKGAGKTPYSRHADGRAVLRSSIREFVASEALHHLGVPTTRALSLVATGESVLRDMLRSGNAKMEPGAVVCRVAPSFLRFGSFQLPASRGGLEKDLVRMLADYAIRHHFPHLEGLPDTAEVAAANDAEEAADVDVTKNKYSAWFSEVAESTGRLVAAWQSVGFTHGVLNTDNMSVLGLTIDYGPFGFLDAFDPQYTPNTTDLPGRRYCFQAQPDIGLWNVVQLANALLTAGLMSTEAAQQCISRYADTFLSEYQARMSAKLGLRHYSKDLTQALLRHMAADEVDFTNLFRALAGVKSASDTAEGERDLLAPLAGVLGQQLPEDRRKAWTDWLHSYIAQLNQEGVADAERKDTMDAVNPCYIPRNYLLQTAIEAAEKGDYSEVKQLYEVLKRPFEEQEGMSKYSQAAPDWAQRPGVCMLSCSS
eukprot:jgi/Mesen1/7073/ME000369S06402